MTTPIPQGTLLKTYLAGGTTWLYPQAGDAQAPPNTKILLLTEGGVAIIGHWYPDARAWHPLPLRDKAKDALTNSPAGITTS